MNDLYKLGIDIKYGVAILMDGVFFILRTRKKKQDLHGMMKHLLGDKTEPMNK